MILNPDTRSEDPSKSPYSLYLNSTYRQVVLDKILCQVRHLVSSSQMESFRLDAREDHLIDGLAYELRGLLAGKRQEYSQVTGVTFYPESWWDHLKLTLRGKFPRFRRWIGAVKMKKLDLTTHHVLITRICPHLNVDNSGEEKHLRFLMMDQPETWHGG